jgi:hypothetical protein
MKNRVGLFLVVAACAGTSAHAGILYTVRVDDNMLRSFDTQSLTFTDIGQLGVGFDFGDLAYDHSTSTMYMVQGFAGTGLYTVNLTEGDATLVGAHGFTDMFGIAYHSGRDELYGSRSTTGFGVYTLDRGNGSASFVGDPGVGLDAITYDPVRDRLVGAYAGPGDIYEIDPDTGGSTLLFDGDFFDNCGMAYDPDTDLYWLIDWSGNMYTINPDEGDRTLVLSGLGAHDGLASTTPIPAPGALALLGLACGIRRRRRD